MRGLYTYIYKTLRSANYNPSALGYDPDRPCMFQSMLDLVGNFQRDIVFRSLDRHFPLNVAVYHSVELSLSGQNVSNRRHRVWQAIKVLTNSVWRF